MTKLGLAVGVIAMVAIGCGGDDDDAGGTTFEVTLTTAAEVPPCAGAGGSATGEATIVVSEDNSTADVDATWSGLSGPATAAHIHAGASNVAGPALLPFPANPTSPLDESFTSADFMAPPAGSTAPADFAAFVQAIRDGESYINVHTAACMPGEIRAQITN